MRFREGGFFHVNRRRLWVGAATLAVACFAAFLTALRSEAAFADENGRIAFQSDRDGDWEIYSMNPNGSDETRLTNNKVFDGQPAISDSGRTIAFVSTRTDSPSGAGVTKPRIWIMNSDGTGQPKLVSERPDSTKPDMKSDTHITFESPYDVSGCAGARPQQIFSADFAGEDLPVHFRRVTDTCFDTLDPIFGPGPYGGILYQRKFFADPNPWIERTFPDIFGRYDATHVDCIYPCLWGFAVWGGQTAAYSVGAAGKPKIWVGRPAGDDLGDGRYGRPQPVPGSAVWGEQDDRHPSYAPAGNWIAVDRSRQDIFRLSFPPDSRGFDRLTKKGHNTNPDWGRMPSPD